jgi:radical SAM superfamily enzyme YgiQ (UPF0313 family)
MPLGLLHAASTSADSFRIIIFDQRTSLDWRQDLADIILKESPFAIGATMFIGPPTANSLSMLGFAAEISNAHRFVGGVLPTIAPETCFNDAEKRIASVVCGEGESSLGIFLERVSAGESLKGAPGVCFASDGEVVKNPLPPLINLDSAPEIPYNLVPTDKYLPAYNGRKTFYIETSRGCPFKCGYCYNSVFNRGAWRAQSPDRVRERLIRAKEEFGANSVYFVDDNFFADKQRGLDIASILMDLRMDWQLQGVDIQSVKKMTPENLTLLKKSGLVRISIGVESGSDRVRRFLGKSFSNSDVYESISTLKEFGFIVFCSFMCDIPTETFPELRESVEMALKATRLHSNLRVSPFYRHVPSPGTRIFEASVKAGRPAPSKIEGWGSISFDWDENINVDDSSRFPFQRLHMATLFCDRKSREYSSSPAFRFLAAIYRPIARFRLKRMFFGFMPEAVIFEKFLKRRSEASSR